MNLCPNCGSLTEFSAYFGKEFCPNDCDYEDDTVKRMRNLRDRIFSDPELFKKYEELILTIINE